MDDNTKEEKKKGFLKPTKETLFHIDFDWWKENDPNWKVTLQSCLCSSHAKFYETNDPETLIDSVNPETGEVNQTDSLIDIIFRHCSQQTDFISSNGTLTDSVFRLFLSNINQPLNVTEIGEKINRSPDIILKTLTGGRIYRGIKPI